MTGTAGDLRGWIIERVAFYADQDPADIDPAAPITSYRLDSVSALALCGDLEDYLTMPVDPTVIWDSQTVAALVERVERLLAEMTAAPDAGALS
jgi:acyl carrier protein